LNAPARLEPLGAATFCQMLSAKTTVLTTRAAASPKSPTGTGSSVVN
jgi:hypothetical protein